MSEFTTDLMKVPVQNESVEEFFRIHLEKAVNALLKVELTEFPGCKKNIISKDIAPAIAEMVTANAAWIRSLTRYSFLFRKIAMVAFTNPQPQTAKSMS